MQILARILACALLVALQTAAPARPAGSSETQFADALRDELAKSGIPSVSIAQIVHGKIVRVATYGVQDAGLPATSASLYNIASLTKPLTAELVLRLASQGKLSLDEPMDNAFIDPDLAKDPRHSLLTPRLALTHRTGLPNWRAPSGLAFDHDPGGKWAYSGEGFQYLARFVEARMGQSLDRLADIHVFGPLGMRSTSYVGKPWFAGRIAAPHDAAGKMLVPTVTQRANAADLVYSTPRDYAAFMLGVIADRGLSRDIARQRSQSQVSLMDITCQGKHAATCPPLVGFGLGWQLMEFPGEKILMHTGKDEGLFTFAYINRTTRDGVVIFTNSDVGYKIVLPVLERTGTSPAFLRFLRGQMD